MLEVSLVSKPPHVPADRVRVFNVWAPPGFQTDVHKAWRDLQTSSPDVVWTPQNGGHWVALRADVIKAGFEDYERFSSRCILVPKAAGEAFQWKPVTLDPPEHAPYRVHLTTAFSPKSYRPYEARIRAIASDLINGFLPRGRCNFQKDFGAKLPIMVFMEIMDLPLEDAWTLRDWSDRLTRRTDDDAEHVTRLFNDYLRPHVLARRGGDGADAITALVNSHVKGEQISVDDALILVTSALQAGLDTVANFLGYAFTHLARDAELRNRLVEQPELIPDATDELLRRYSVVTIGRLVVKDTTLGGAQLIAGEMIVLPSMLAGLDDRVNEQPEQVDLARAGQVSATFGGGAHRCPGERLARREIAIAIEEWLKIIPQFEVQPGFSIEFETGVVPVAKSIPLRWQTARSG